MKKSILITFLLFASIVSIAQTKPTFTRTPDGPNIIEDKNLKAGKFLIVPIADVPGIAGGSIDSAGYLRYNPTTKAFQGYYGPVKGWGDIGGSQVLPAGPFTSSNTGIGFNPGSNVTVQQFVNAVWYASQPPTVSLTGGSVRELTSASTENASITYTYGKQAGTQNIASAIINGSTTGVTQNINGASGSYSVTLSANITNTYTLTATAADNKSASASTAFTYSPKRYWGRCSASPFYSEMLAAAGGGSQLSTSRTGTFTVTASGSNYLYFMYPASEGSLTQIKDGNGLDVTSGFNTSTILFTNASGYTQNYNIYVSTNATSASYTITTL